MLDYFEYERTAVEGASADSYDWDGITGLELSMSESGWSPFDQPIVITGQRPQSPVFDPSWDKWTDAVTGGVFTASTKETCDRSLVDVIYVVGSRITSSRSRTYPTDYSGGWHQIGPPATYNSLAEPAIDNSINWVRNGAYFAIGIAHQALRTTPAGIVLFGVSQFHEMTNHSRTGVVDLGSLAIP